MMRCELLPPFAKGTRTRATGTQPPGTTQVRPRMQQRTVDERVGVEVIVDVGVMHKTHLGAPRGGESRTLRPQQRRSQGLHGASYFP